MGLTAPGFQGKPTRLWEWLGFAQWQPGGRMFAFMATVALILALAAMLFYVVERPARSRLRDQMGKLAPE